MLHGFRLRSFPFPTLLTAEESEHRMSERVRFFTCSEGLREDAAGSGELLRS